MTVPFKNRSMPISSAEKPSTFNSEKFLKDCEQLGIEVERHAAGVWTLQTPGMVLSYAPFSTLCQLACHRGNEIYSFERVTTSLVIEIALGVVLPEEIPSGRLT